MKKILILLIGVAAILSTTSCTRNVEEHEVAVCVKRPYLAGSDGTEVLMPGRHWVAWSSELFFMDNIPQKFQEPFTNLTTKDKSDVDFDFYFNLSINPNKADGLFGNFGLEWYKTNLQPEFRRIIRDKGMAFDMIPITSDPKVSQDIEIYVLKECRKIIKRDSIPVILNSVSMGKATPPKEVLIERSATAAAKQRENTLVQENKNLIQEEDNEKRRGMKDKAYMKELNLNTKQLVELERLKVDMARINAQKIAYKKAKTVIVDGSSGMNPTYPVQ